MSFRIIAGRFKGRILTAPKGLLVRPTQGIVREAVFNICQNEIQEARFLDLFAGSGAMGLEALSRGASHVTFVEHSKNSIASIRQNIALLQVQAQTVVLPCDVQIAIRKLSDPFHIIYVDPPYDFSAVPVIQLLCLKKLLHKGAILFLETRYHAHLLAPDFPLLCFIESRRFGDAALHHYKLGE